MSYWWIQFTAFTFLLHILFTYAFFTRFISGGMYLERPRRNMETHTRPWKNSSTKTTIAWATSWHTILCPHISVRLRSTTCFVDITFWNEWIPLRSKHWNLQSDNSAWSTRDCRCLFPEDRGRDHSNLSFTLSTSCYQSAEGASLDNINIKIKPLSYIQAPSLNLCLYLSPSLFLHSLTPAFFCVIIAFSNNW